MAETDQKNLAIIGGGISGLTAAYYAIQNGQPPSSITIYEAANRLGGKIQTGYLNNGTPVNMGAEFIDSDHTHILELCRELGVPLNQSTDQGTELFLRPNGKVMKGEDFHAAYQPLAERILADKQEIQNNPDSARAQHLYSLSLNDYITELRHSTPVIEQPNFAQRAKNFIMRRDNLVSAEVATMAMQAFASEAGQPPRHVSALQFLQEASSELGSFLDSDCAYRVEGGTEKIIDALSKHLQEQGVQIVQQAKLEAVDKTDDGTSLAFGNGMGKASQVIFALPTYAYKNIAGLETLGITPQVKQFVDETQYTNSVKFIVKMKDGVPPPNANMFANHGFQAWSSGDSEMTFLANADKLKKMSPTQLIEQVTKSYANGIGTKPEALFDLAPGNVVFNNPGQNACYATPAPGKAMPMLHLEDALGKMADHGAAMVGTFLPVQTDSGCGLGFMECGAASASRAIERLVQVEKARPMWLDDALERGAAKQPVAAASVTR